MYRQIAFTLYEPETAVDPATLVEAIRARHPGANVSLPEAVSAAGGDAPAFFILFEGKSIVVAPAPAPLPRDDGFVEQASRRWPEARTAFERHRSHVIVSSLGTDEHALPAARIITAVVGALVAAAPGCAGVVWSGAVATPAQDWIELSPSAFAPYPDFPFSLWINIQPFRYDSSIGAATRGLSSFVGREIELEGNGLDLQGVVTRVWGLAAYLIDRGSVISNGDTFGFSASDRLRVRHAISRRSPGVPILLASHDPTEGQA
jgi:hypothetical protein